MSLQRSIIRTRSRKLQRKQMVLDQNPELPQGAAAKKRRKRRGVEWTEVSTSASRTEPRPIAARLPYLK